MKRNKHILINIDEDLYNSIVYLANSERRKAAEYLYLLVSDEIQKRILTTVDRGGRFKQPYYIKEE